MISFVRNDHTDSRTQMRMHVRRRFIYEFRRKQGQEFAYGLATALTEQLERRVERQSEQIVEHGFRTAQENGPSVHGELCGSILLKRVPKGE